MPHAMSFIADGAAPADDYSSNLAAHTDCTDAHHPATPRHPPLSTAAYRPAGAISQDLNNPQPGPGPQPTSMSGSQLATSSSQPARIGRRASSKKGRNQLQHNTSWAQRPSPAACINAAEQVNAPRACTCASHAIPLLARSHALKSALLSSLRRSVTHQRQAHMPLRSPFTHAQCAEWSRTAQHAAWLCTAQRAQHPARLSCSAAPGAAVSSQRCAASAERCKAMVPTNPRGCWPCAAAHDTEQIDTAAAHGPHQTGTNSTVTRQAGHSWTPQPPQPHNASQTATTAASSKRLCDSRQQRRPASPASTSPSSSGALQQQCPSQQASSSLMQRQAPTGPRALLGASQRGWRSAPRWHSPPLAETRSIQQILSQQVATPRSLPGPISWYGTT
jgi:hypothetical protein